MGMTPRKTTTVMLPLLPSQVRIVGHPREQKGSLSGHLGLRSEHCSQRQGTRRSPTARPRTIVNGQTRVMNRATRP